MRTFWNLACTALLVLLLTGCASTRAPATLPAFEAPAAAASEPVARSWWQLALRRPYDGSTEPDWTVDLLLADRVLAPLLRAEAARLPLWRFHRRAGVDAAGHQLSLIVYTDAATAERIFNAVREDALVQALLARGALTELWAGCHLGRPCSGEVAATSDPDWHPALGASWPHFIMGASASWLALIEALRQGVPAGTNDLDTLLPHYARIRQQMNEIWRGQGQHAYLHHLSAVFGYEPLLVTKEIRF